MRSPALTTRFRPTVRQAWLVPLLALAAVATARDYRWITLAGSNGGSGLNDGPGSTARFSGPDRLAVDAAGTAWIVDTNNHSIRKITSNGTVSTVAGQPGVAGARDGGAALFASPRGIALSATGEIYIADTGNHTIRRITPDGITHTHAGSGGIAGSSNGPRDQARFNAPRGLAFDANQRLLVADTGNHVIRRIEADGTVVTLAGLAGIFGSADGSSGSARFRLPRSLVSAPDGTIYVADSSNHTIRKIAPDGTVTTLAGLAGSQGLIDGPSATARFRLPNDLTLAPDGSLRVADQLNARIRRVDTNGTVSTLSGAFTLVSPAGIAYDAAGNLLVTGGNAITRVTPDLQGGILAGNPAASGNADGPASAALFLSPAGISLQADGALLIADTGNHTIRRMAADGQVTTLAGVPGSPGNLNGPAAHALFKEPRAALMDPAGTIFVADTGNDVLRRIDPDGTVSLHSGAPQTLSSAERYVGPTGLARTSAGGLLISDHNLIRRLDPSGVMTNLAGPVRLAVPGQDTLFWRRTLDAGSDGDGTGSSAMIRASQSPWLASDGTVYFTDSDLHTVRKLGNGNIVTTLAGQAAVPGFSDGVGPAAKFSSPKGVVRDPEGNLIVADTTNHVVRRIDATGNVTTIGGIPGYPGSGEGIGRSAQFRSPEGITIDSSGIIRLADTGNHRIVVGVPQPVADPANRPPRYTGYSLATTASRPVAISLRKLLASITDPDGDLLSVTTAGPRSTAAGYLALNTHHIDYTPPLVFIGIDELPVTVTDGRGGVIQIKVTITLVAESAASSGTNNPPALLRRPDGSVEVTFHGIPRVSYPVQRSTDLAVWENLTIVTAGATGRIEFIDLAPPAGTAFYRLTLP